MNGYLNFMQSIKVNVKPESEAIDVTPKYDIVLKDSHNNR